MRHSASSIAKFLGFIIYLNHVLACIFYLIGDYERGEGRISWLDHESLENQRSNLPLAYLYAFYFSLMTTTTIGYGDVHPVSASGRVFALVAMAIGACVFSYGVTHVITLMSSLNKQEQAFREKMDRIATYMSFRNLPPSLRSDVREFFHYTHSTKTEKRMLEVEKEILAEMSPSLSHEVVLYVNRQIVDKVVFLREVDHRFFQRIVRNLEPATFAPNELVMKEGEIGKKLYIISKGVVELLKTEKMRRVDTRADGGHFGMISIVPNGPTKGKRVCSIRTMTYCDFRTISKRAFNRGLRRYPGVKEDVEHLVAKEFEDFTKMCERTLNPLGGAGRAMQDTMHTMLAAGGLFGLDHGNDGRIGEDDEQSQDGAVKEGINVVETSSLATSPPASPKLSARRRRGTTRALSISNALGNVFRSNSPRSSKEGGSGGGVVGGVEADPGDGSLAACTPTKKKGRAKSAMRRHSDLRQRRNSDLRVEIEGEDVPHSDEDDEDGAMKVLTRSTSMEGRLQVDRLRKLMDRLEDFLNRVAPEGKSESKSSIEEGASEGRTDDVDGEIGGTDEKGVLPGIG